MADCIFCKIIKGELPSTKVFEDENIVAFKDINPMAPVHVLIVPKIHFSSLTEAEDDHQVLLGKLLLIARDLAKKLEISKKGYKVVINNGPDSGQIVYHLHLHLLGGWTNKVNSV
ncbi:histidine triad nucleotide-binding protein [Candidatus Microgenomates bacterium]|nr:histidine triad nucleotide-binding protein [Candidatus Microgenomates bacterium]